VRGDADSLSTNCCSAIPHCLHARPDDRKGGPEVQRHRRSTRNRYIGMGIERASLTSTWPRPICFIALVSASVQAIRHALLTSRERVDGGMQVERERDPLVGWTPEAILLIAQRPLSGSPLAARLKAGARPVGWCAGTPLTLARNGTPCDFASYLPNAPQMCRAGGFISHRHHRERVSS